MRQLVDWLARLNDEAVPPPVCHEVKRRVLDSVGVAMAGWDGEACRIAREMACEVACVQGGATVWGTRHKASADLATFANSTQIRYLDYNDTYLSLEPAHPSDNIGACMAAGEAIGATGRRVMTAIAAAYEIHCRLCDAAAIRPRGWDHVVYGAISTSAAVGWLWDLRGEQLAHAISLGVVSSIAMRQTRLGHLSEWEGCAFANSARNSVFAVDLARRGMTGPLDVFTGAMGLFKQVTGPLEIKLPAAEDFMILQTYLKFWPAQYYAQSAIEAACHLRSRIAEPAQIEEINIESFEAAIEVIASDAAKWHPTGRATASHSLPYCVAVAVLDGDVNLGSFSERRMADPELHELIQRVHVHRSEELNRGYPEGVPHRLRVRMRDGRELTQEVKYPRGHAGNPMSDEEVREKFTRTASLRLPVPNRARLAEEVWHLDQVHDLTALFELMVI